MPGTVEGIGFALESGVHAAAHAHGSSRSAPPDRTILASMDATASDALDPLVLYRYRVDLTLGRPLALPAHQRAVLWRGAFGAVFRSLVCHDEVLACEACPLRSACPFPRVFAPFIPEGRPEILRLRDPPRPFVLTDPQPDAATLAPGGPIALGLTVVGTAVVDLPYFVVALRRLGDEGLGRTRVRFRVEAVRCLDADAMPGASVYAVGADVVRPSRAPLRARDLARPGDGAARRVRVRFITPTDVRGAAAPEAEATPGAGPSFGVLVRRARDRAGALATFFGDGPLGADPRALAAQADGVRTASSELGRVDLARRSSRTGQRHALGGIVGAAVYEGEGVAAAMPWLRLAEVIGVGKHATFGQGRIAVEVLG
jgi:hypothetical protein